MARPTPFANRQRILVFVALVILFCSLYSFTYSGDPLSGDELFLFNATASQVHFGDSLLDIVAGNNRPLVFDVDQPLNSVVADPMQIILAMPIYWLAEQIPGIGMLHTVWMFNVVITALGVGVFYLLAGALGFSDRASALAALCLGMGSVLFPYSKTFFNEPLLMLFLLITTLLLHRWYASGYRAWGAFIGAVFLFAAAYLTKAAALLALPGMVMFIVPVGYLHTSRWGRRALRLMDALFILAVLILILLVYLPPLSLREYALPIYTMMGGGRGILRNALQGYFFSIGGSFWGTSPVLLLAVPGLWLLYRRTEHRLIYAVLVLVAGFAVGYAVLRGAPWFGGLSWPPRFLVPIIPFAMLLTLPVFEHIVRPPRPIFTRALFSAVLVYAVWVQISGVTLRWTVYPLLLPPEAAGFLEWSGGLNSVSYLRWVLLPTAWDQYPLDIAWVRANTPLWALALTVLVMTSGLLLLRLLNRPAGKRLQRAVVLLIPLYALVLWAGLRGIYPDPIMNGDNPALHDLLPIIRAEVAPDDVLLLSNRAYATFFLNYGKHLPARVVGLPDAPGEQPSPEQLPLTTSPNVEALMEKQTPPLMHYYADRHPRIWLLVNASPFIPWAVRPEERYLSTHYYPLKTIALSPTVRLLGYSAVDAPDTFAFRAAQQTTDLCYGDALILRGYELPLGSDYLAGDDLPISLYWLSSAPLSADYTVAVKLAAQDGQVVASAEDSYPVGGFMPTTLWIPNIPVWDHRALPLPPDLPAGDYRLWVIVYDGSSGAPQNLPVVGAEVREGSFGVLPAIITVYPPG